MFEFNAIVLLRRAAGNPCDVSLTDEQRFVELKADDTSRISQAYRKQGRTGDQARIQNRFERGFRCFAVTEGEEMVAWFWALHGIPRYLDEMGWLFPLDKRQVWVRDAFVVPERRGKKVLAAMLAIGTTIEPEASEYISDVSSSNKPSLRAHHGMGFEPFATVRGLSLGPLLWRGGFPAGLPQPSALRPQQRLVWMSAEERAWHRAQIA